MLRMQTNWSRVKPHKQVENMPHAIKSILGATTLRMAVIEGKSIFMSYRNRELGTKVHGMALDKVMHGSVNKYFDVTPIGRVI